MLRNNCLKVLLLAIAGLTACAGSAVRPSMLEERLAEKNFYVSEAVEEIRRYRVDGWNYLDRKHLIVEAGPANFYLVSLATACHGLGSAEDIAFSTTAGRLTRYDNLLVMGIGGREERCYIEALHKLERIDD